jgi:pimeloyl-ACP methyl ester carboxylesterase
MQAMSSAANDGVRLRYEVVGRGPPLVLHPGFASCAEDWEGDGYVAALQDRYQLILLDPRGQGQSDKPHDPAAYTLGHRVADILAVLDAAGIDRAHFWGYSMGGWIGFALGAQAPHRLRSLVLGGAHPFLGNPRPVDEDEVIAGLRQGMAALVGAWEAASPEYWQSPGRRDRWLGEDAAALVAARQQQVTEPDLTEEAVAAISVPSLLYAGTRDEVEEIERTARLMPNATFVALDGLNHLQAYTRRDVVLPHVLAFVSRADERHAERS